MGASVRFWDGILQRIVQNAKYVAEAAKLTAYVTAILACCGLAAGVAHLQRCVQATVWRERNVSDRHVSDRLVSLRHTPRPPRPRWSWD